MRKERSISFKFPYPYFSFSLSFSFLRRKGRGKKKEKKNKKEEREEGREKGRLVIQPATGGITSQRTGEMMFGEVSYLKISLARRGMTAKIEPRQFNIGQI